ncbi:hypothetical protein AVEN_168729-1 [Araneus ventricosus]|uniref:Uncharacterized protein n=3 Tax=Araneus ventricosus TaxID=182803 RepID=A0A4Y2X8L9_ARAVE|nr:hypothetical protein AVEN_81147-1 [Araneus ventricosus]GBO45292.1 hypothetical protein AVEN_158248-1 [Araneus ventricosus]GBO45294.1 hypothetical protein AVEN_168729-1 [Araneus ventricosus]
MIKHFMHKCSVNYALARPAICIDPRVMAGYPEKTQEKNEKGGMAADDLFSHLFGGGLFGMGMGMGGSRRRKRGDDTVYPLK